jgi:hypothetical protein
MQDRLLVLQYQIIEIALYQELCDLMWVGPEGNDTADWWYKCDQDGARNENGLYMRVMDARGLFIRGAGANAVKTGANDTPYNGNAIGAFIGDTIRNIVGSFYQQESDLSMFVHPSYPVTGGALSYYRSPRVLRYAPASGQTGGMVDGISFDASRVVPTSTENRPASVSSCLVITY